MRATTCTCLKLPLNFDAVNLVDRHLEMKPGEACYRIVNHHHRVTNGGTSDRIHLVIDCVVKDWLWGLAVYADF
jgi:hypothetical protein